MSSWDEPPIIYYRNTFQPVNTISRQLPTIPSRTVNPTIGTQLLLKIILPSIVVISIIATVTIIVCVLLKISQNTTQDQITTTGLYTTTEPNQTLVLRRRSIEVVGAPSAMVYVDSHQMAGSHGNVTRVSFYADHTCALNFVEFAAFDLIHRDVDLNTAELIVTHRSGPLQLGTPNELKPYMTLITIQLCSEKLMQNINSGVCQGNQFPVLPHHYIGVRSDKCRLGFVQPSLNLVFGTTWTHSDRSDPFNKPYQILNYVPVNYTILQSITIDSFEKNNIQRTDPKDIRSTQLRVLFIGTYPPRQCGLAKYLEDLIDNYKGSYGIVAIDEKDLKSTDRNYSNNVVFRLKQNEREIYYKVAEMANSQGYDVVNIQHEYGLYGGMCGEYIVHLLASVRKPIIITMHTVLPKPTEFYLSLTRTIAALSTRIIVLSPVGRRLLVDLYGVDETKISIVHHGVPDVPFSQILTEEKQKLGFDAKRPIMATFGLLHRDKNIQLVLKAMKNIIEYVPNILYLVLGQTHPLIKLHEGDSYRHELENNVTTLSLVNNVYFVNKYLDDKELISYLSASDIYITPYIHEEQYVSGTLAWAVGLGKAVVSTPYLYAKELLAHGRGFLIPFNGHQALSSTIITLVQNQEIRDAARRKAYKFGRQMIWPSVTCDYENIFRDALLYF
ncbi:unnamed protein product [Rotaria sp. Silwood1]|nr:unnamed protein product [Rotaria sp. Silwood1]CAF4672206.1 unnamed protein product [Rotaria sp. Silwood1]CAF4780673.1 unnamed protein product [Rotaria sp. Silwood1]